jgi:hypothetical protein
MGKGWVPISFSVREIINHEEEYLLQMPNTTVLLGLAHSSGCWICFCWHPTEIGAFSNVYDLNVDQSEVAGTLPKELGLLESLAVFSLDTNRISGSMPTENGQLSRIQQRCTRD